MVDAMLSRQPADDDPAFDLGLARRAASGDELAFAQLYRRHHPRVHRYCARLLGSPEDAADAAQQTFLSMHRCFARGVTPRENVVGYILQVARRESFHLHHRRVKHQRAQEVSLHHVRDHASVADHAPRVIDAHTIRAAAAALPERHRAVLVMREVRDMSYDQIARDLGLTENAVAQLIHRARKRLAGELGHVSRDARSASRSGACPSRVAPAGAR
jgi:RNA polymerase sigma factor (sigma-70 family)